MKVKLFIRVLTTAHLAATANSETIATAASCKTLRDTSCSVQVTRARDTNDASPRLGPSLASGPSKSVHQVGGGGPWVAGARVNFLLAQLMSCLGMQHTGLPPPPH